MNPWFYVDPERQRHQVTEEQLQSLAASGAVRPDTLVWTEGQPQWSPALQVTAGAFPAHERRSTAAARRRRPARDADARA